MAKCHHCGRNFSKKDLKNASEEKNSPVGDYDWVCYACQLKMDDKGTWADYKGRMLILHNGSGQCEHGQRKYR